MSFPVISLFFLLTALTASHATLQFPSHVANKMVLNHALPKLPGYGTPNTIITVLINGKKDKRQTVVPLCNFTTVHFKFLCPFEIILPVVEPSYLLNTIELYENGGEGNTFFRFEQVLFGKVFLCSGQSNMWFSVNQLHNASQEINDSINYKYLRLFQIPPTYDATPQFTAPNVYDGWATSNPSALKGDGNFTYFSAVCYLFGKQLYEMYSNKYIPIGLIASAYGGTPLQSWSTPNALQDCPYAIDDHDNNLLYPATFKSVTYNAMINPLKNISLTSIVWYQGEYEGEDKIHEQYKCQFPAMVNDWRKNVFNDLNLPFVYVGLAPALCAPGNVGYIKLRNAQKSILGLNNTGFVDAFDLGDLNTPWPNHSRRKRVIGKRLGLLIYDMLNVAAKPAAKPLLKLSSKLSSEASATATTTATTITTAKSSASSSSIRSFKAPILLTAIMSPSNPNLHVDQYIELLFSQSDLTINETYTYGNDDYNPNQPLPSCSNNGKGPFEMKINGEWIYLESKIDIHNNAMILLKLNQSIHLVTNQIVYLSIRYAWQDAPLCGVYNQHAIPVSPFCKSVIYTHTIKPKHTFLMVDDHDVLYRSGASRKLQPMTRQPDINIQRARHSEFFLAYSTTHFIDGNFHTWYQCCNTHGVNCFVCKSTSPDGSDFLADIQKQYPQTYSTENVVEYNNIVLPGDGGRYGASVVHDPQETNKSRTYKMASWAMYDTNKYKQRPGMYVHFSIDGTKWDRYDEGGPPQIQGAYGGPSDLPPFSDQDSDNRPNSNNEWLSELAMSDALNILKDERTGEYSIYHKTWLDNNEGAMFWKRAVAKTDSKDFINWSTKRQLVAVPDDRDDITTSFLSKESQSIELHGGPVLYHKASGLYFMFLQHLDWTDASLPGILQVELAVSHNNGSYFDRMFRKVDGFPMFLSVNEEKNQFNSGTIWMDTWGHTFYGESVEESTKDLPSNDEEGQEDKIVSNILTTKFLYGAYASWNMLPGANASGIGIATMVHDRYSYFEPTNVMYGGQITLKPHLFDNVKNIYVNCDGSGQAYPSSSVLIEILDEYGYRVRGFEKNLFVPITTNQGNGLAKWNVSSIEMDLKQPNMYSIRIHLLGGAKIYAVTLV